MGQIISPRVSIVLPTHNRAKYIRQAINSCLVQSYKNIELIIVDDASADNTLDIIKSYNDSRIKYVKNEENIGLAKSLNKGFSLASGEYLTWTSDDNFYSEKAIEAMVRMLERDKRTDFIYANYYLIDEDGNLTGKVNVGPPRGLDRANCIGACFLFRNKVYREVGDFNPEVISEDYEYWLRVREKFRMGKIDGYLYYYRTHKESLTGKYGLEMRKDLMASVRNKYISPSAKYCLEGEKLYYKNDRANAKKLFLKALLLNPFNFAAVRMLGLIYFPPSLVQMIKKIKRKFQRGQKEVIR
jgi:glycosyltransferase involved in cell wall biosynthesis